MEQTYVSTKELNKTLESFSRSNYYYLHSKSPDVFYSQGIEYLIQQGNTYWLLDAIANFIGSEAMLNALEKDERLRKHQSWTLYRIQDLGNMAELEGRALWNSIPFIRKAIDARDFPLEHIVIKARWDDLRWILYLPSEQ